MKMLSSENIDFIYHDVQEKGITMDVLLDEMVDHICCSIEPEIDKGISFEAAYNNLMDTIESSTFKNVQHQTLLSINLKFQNMKKVMIVLGSLGALLLWSGSILKMLHLPYASIILLLGAVITVLGFLPLFFYTSYKEQTEKKNFLLPVTSYLTLSFLIIGLLFKVMHWPGAAIALLIGEFLLVLLFLPLYLVNAYKKASETKVKVGYVLLIVLIGFGIIFMVSSTRLSKNIVDRYDSINSNAMYVIQKFTNQNDSLMKVFKMNESYVEIQSQVDKLRELSYNLDLHIEKIKTELKNYSNVNTDGTIKFKDDSRAFSKAMYNDGNAIKLEQDFNKYRDFVLELSDNDFQKETLNALLDFQMFTGLTYDQGFKRTSLIEGLAMLSSMQKNIKISEYKILYSLK
ncbi:MAG: hypothetical protein A2W99_11200 [Bacteroidetes bacterium GWF2_33_16]|nr:MAG: hypothetical protein A2X00_04540 [Bacteroidetes bacterium GWE2_32_14]OFY04101.1 MAG: hypothetical protein A2W99_11200 [Bacteroidetes bacterium GWF2_33_16]